MQSTAADLDFETASPVDLKTAGVYVYAEDPATRMWLFSWSIGGGPKYRYHLGDADPVALLDHIRNGGVVVAHNAPFERLIWRMIVTRWLPHWPLIQIEQQRCTMAKALALALPADLDTLGHVLGLTNTKDAEGTALMRQMMKPRRRNPDGTYIWWDEPAKIERLGAYCDQDVRTEEEADRVLPDLTPYEQALWCLNEHINERGVYVDVDAISRAVDTAEAAKRRINARIRAVTQGAVQKTSQVKEIIAFINTRGFQVESLRKGDHEELMLLGDYSGDPLVREVIQLRRDGSKTSTAKYQAMLRCIGNDGRIRGMIQFDGAGKTGRFAGRLVQPHNLPRMDPDVDGNMVEYTIGLLTKHLSPTDVCELLEWAGYSPLVALSKSVRGAFRAEPGNEFFGGDFSNIEGRINAWLAGEQWKLLAFQAYDDGTGPDLYKVGAAGILGKTPEKVTKNERQTLGKVPELACGFQGGVGAFVTMGQTQTPPLNPANMVEPVLRAVGNERWEKTLARYDGAFDAYNLPETHWAAIKITVENWRATNAAITHSWWELQDAAIEAVETPNVPVAVYSGRVHYVCVEGWLYCQLPSTRIIAYCQPYLSTVATEMVKVNGKWTEVDRFFPHELDALRAAGCEFWTKYKTSVGYWGIDGETKQWTKQHLYGGLQCENIVQATARCVLDHALFRVEAAGYPIVLHVHDEILSELAKGIGSVAEYKSLMSVKPDWLAGMPLAAAAWQDERYVK